MDQSTKALRKNLASVQFCRAVSAVLVVLFHNSVAIFGIQKYWNVKPFGKIFDFGHAGVEFFFVLSGFIMIRVHYDDIDRPTAVGRYVVNRLRRIYPIYWIAVLLVLPIFIFGEGRRSMDPIQVISSVILLVFRAGNDLPENLFLPVSWTLLHEILFYFIFMVTIFNRKLGFFLLISWVLMSIPFLFFHFDGVASFYFSPLHSLFLMGMAVFILQLKFNIIASPFLLIAGLVIFYCAGFDEIVSGLISHDVRILSYGLGSAIILLALTNLEERGLISFYPIFSLIGDASYSIYLIHFPVLSLMAKVLVKIHVKSEHFIQLFFVINVIIAILSGVLLHLYIEKPLLNRLGRHGRRSIPNKVVVREEPA